MVNTPVPASLKSEAKKAAKILQSFSMPSAKVGPDAIIPTGLLVNAEGLAILTVVKLGFLITARGGSGIVIAKLPDGRWSAPSAIGIAGLGGGLEIGAEVTDFVIILTKRSAVDAFSKGGNLTLGGNFTVAAGPIGRNVEGGASVRSPAAIYTYSKTKGLFAGISVEGSALIERKDANKKFYGENIRAYDILGGNVEPPESCWELYDILAQHKEMFKNQAIALAKREGKRQAKEAMHGGGIVGMVKNFTGRSRSSSTSASTERRESTSSMGSRSSLGMDYYDDSRSSLGMDYYDDSTSPQMNRSYSVRSLTTTTTTSSRKSGNGLRRHASATTLSQRTETRTRVTQEKVQVGSQRRPSYNDAWDNPPKARVLWDYEPQMDCDLPLQPGDEITILTRTHTQDDWWEGELNGKVGIFPANYVEVL